MIDIPNWDEINPVHVTGKSELIPPGEYKVVVKDAFQAQSQNDNNCIVLYLDIAEGEYEGYFHKKYTVDKENSQNAKWRCDLWQAIEGTGTPYFKGMIECFEESNEDFTWDGEEKDLIGLNIGAIFEIEEYQKPDGTMAKLTKLQHLIPLQPLEQ